MSDPSSNRRVIDLTLSGYKHRPKNVPPHDSFERIHFCSYISDKLREIVIENFEDPFSAQALLKFKRLLIPTLCLSTNDYIRTPLSSY